MSSRLQVVAELLRLPACAASIAVVNAFLVHIVGLEFAHVTGVTTKSSLLNTVFAKWAWLWTLVVLAAGLLETQNYSGSCAGNNSDGARRPFECGRLKRLILRFTTGTLYWLAVTKGLVGASLFERLRDAFGGQCLSAAGVPLQVASEPQQDAQQCVAQGGRWVKGHHDISGHCFLLVHSSLMLQLEFRSEPRQPFCASAMRVLWTWMLCVTIVYYHSLGEQLLGLALGSACALVLALGVPPSPSS